MVEVGIDALADVEPFALAGVEGEHLAFDGHDGGDIDKEFGLNGYAQGGLQAIGEGVIDGDGLIDGRSGGNGLVVGHTAREGSREGEAAGVHVIFHVVGGGMCQEDGGGDLAEDGGKTLETFAFIEDFEVAADGGMVDCADGFGGGAGFGAAHLGSGGGIEGGAAATAVGECHVVDFVAGIAKQDEGACHGEFDVIRVRAERQSARLG